MTAPLVSAVLDQVARHAGLVFSDVRLASATDTIEAWLTRHEIRTPSHITPGPQLDRLLEELVVHESYFDRDGEQLAMVDELVFAKYARSDENLRVWSAGCAGGEEPYTLAFMIARRDMLARASVLGTDLSRAALARAREGKYRSWSVRIGAQSPAMRYLETCGADLCVPDPVKRAVRFEPLNLLEDPYPVDQHLIICRNVLIYFDTPSIAVIAQRMVAAMHPEGWLFVAPSDPRLDPHAALTPIFTNRGIYYRHRAATEARLAPAGSPPLRRKPPQPSRPPPVLPPVVVRAAAPVATGVPARAALAGDRARQLADRGDYSGARAALASELEASPLDAELHFFAAVLAADEDVPRALKSLERAMYLAPDAPLSYVLAGRLHQTVADPDRARRAYRVALRLLEQHEVDAPVPWTDESASILAAACRASLGALDER